MLKKQIQRSRPYHTHCLILVLLYLILPNIGHAQLQPLSRNDVANVAKNEANYQTALSQNNWKEASRYLNNIAFIHWEHNDYEKAIEYYEESLQLNERLTNENGVAMIHNNLGTLYSDVGKFEEALTYFRKTLAARRSFKNNEGIIASLKNIAVVQNNLGQFTEAQTMLQEALTLARETNDPDQISSCYLQLSESYEKAGDVENTIHYYELYKSFYDLKREKDLANLKKQADEEKILKEIAEVRANIRERELALKRQELDSAQTDLNKFSADKIKLTQELDKTQLQIQNLEKDAEIEKLRSEEKIKRERAFRNLMLVGALSLGLVSFFIYRNFKQEQKSKRSLAAKNDQINKQNEELESLNKIIAKHNKRMKSELDVGREIQMSMIPSEFPQMDHVDLYALLEPALEVGGDLYDFFMLDDDHLIIGVGDVSDKGVPAALFMAVTKTLIKTHSTYSIKPSEILTRVNTELSTDNETSMFVTYFLCVLNVKTGFLTFSNAGHNPPLYLTSTDGTAKLEELHGPVLGAMEGFPYKQGSVQLKTGEQVIMYTDGVTEAMDKDNNLYSDERLYDLFEKKVANNSQDSLQVLIDDVISFRGNAMQSDDITALSFIYKA